MKIGRSGVDSEKSAPITRALYVVAVIAACFPFDSIAGSKNGFPLDDTLIPAAEIRGGGPPKNGIPALIDPQFVDADDASFLKDKDRVLGISRNGVVRAYPIRILNYHEIVNDMLGDEPVVITYCPLCGSGMAFAAMIWDIARWAGSYNSG